MTKRTAKLQMQDHCLSLHPKEDIPTKHRRRIPNLPCIRAREPPVTGSTAAQSPPDWSDLASCSCTMISDRINPPTETWPESDPAPWTPCPLRWEVLCSLKAHSQRRRIGIRPESSVRIQWQFVFPMYSSQVRTGIKRLWWCVMVDSLHCRTNPCGVGIVSTIQATPPGSICTTKWVTGVTLSVLFPRSLLSLRPLALDLSSGFGSSGTGTCKGPHPVSWMHHQHKSEMLFVLISTKQACISPSSTDGRPPLDLRSQENQENQPVSGFVLAPNPGCTAKLDSLQSLSLDH